MPIPMIIEISKRSSEEDLYKRMGIRVYWNKKKTKENKTRTKILNEQQIYIH